MKRIITLAAFGAVLLARGADRHLVATPDGVVSRPGEGTGTLQAVGTYRGWTNALFLSNGHVWTVAVPEVGRVMQFGFVGSPGVLWVNPTLAGRPMFPDPWGEAGSFGGDKTWPAPQSAWNWPPPDVFDATPVNGRWDGSAIVLESPVSPRFGIRTERRVELGPGTNEMRIVTRYHKVSGPPVDVAVWVITQLNDPEASYLPVPSASAFPDGLARTWEVPTRGLRRGEGWVALVRERMGGHKIGNDADALLWVGAREVLRIGCPRVPGAAYPDGGCSAEVYTNGDPAAYVELETLGPLVRIGPGETAAATNLYTLSRRSSPTPDAEASAHLGRAEGRAGR